MILSKLRTTLLAFALLAAATAWGCQVPVFRYALERWEPGRYLVKAPAVVSVDTLTNAEVQVTPGIESLQLHYPRQLRQASAKPIWTAPMNAENLRLMLDSPMRQTLKQRLLSGQSAVWLLIESGDVAKDNAAAAVMEAGLQAAQEKLKLPDGVITQDEASDPKKLHENADILQSDLPLKIEFSTLRLSRQNQQEAALTAMLMHIEPDLVDYVKEPMVFPIFGRGRALEPMIGKGLHADNIYEAAAYLCGACSCEIKEQNPGIDLLMSADWGVVGTDEVLPETVEIQAKPEGPGASPNRWMMAAALFLLAMAGLLWRRKKA